MIPNRSNTSFQATPPPTAELLSRTVLRWSTRLLTVTVWTSAALFGLYILAFYAAALYQHTMQRWNQVLPRLYEPQTTAATVGIGLHFAAGGVILVLGSIQLLDTVRLRWPMLHRWIGRVYVLACLLAALGGLAFIALKGTIGGAVMDVGFAGYGLLMLVCAVETYRHAIARRWYPHRLWALRLYALAIGSWLYRMDYGFWLLLTDGLGHTRSFSGPFDHLMAFFFYVPNLLVVEAFGARAEGQSHCAAAAIGFGGAVGSDGISTDRELLLYPVLLGPSHHKLGNTGLNSPNDYCPDYRFRHSTGRSVPESNAPLENRI